MLAYIALNALTVLRGLMAVPLALLPLYGLWMPAGAIFLFCVLSDIIDGPIARRWNLETVFGLWADYAADACVLVGTISGLVLAGKLFWLAGIGLLAASACVCAWWLWQQTNIANKIINAIFFAVMVPVGIFYLWLASGSAHWFAPALTVTSGSLCYLKRGRLCQLASGQA